MEINLLKASKQIESSHDITFKTAEIKSTINSNSNEKFQTTTHTINNTDRYENLIKKKSSKRVKIDYKK